MNFTWLEEILAEFNVSQTYVYAVTVDLCCHLVDKFY